MSFLYLPKVLFTNILDPLDTIIANGILSFKMPTPQHDKHSGEDREILFLLPVTKIAN